MKIEYRFVRTKNNITGCAGVALAAEPAEEWSVRLFPALGHSIDRYRELGVKFIYLEVRRSNQIARAFYRRFGFLENGERRNYYGREEGYEQETEDAILYLCHL